MDVTQQQVVPVVLEMDLLRLQMEVRLTAPQVLTVLLYLLLLAQLMVVEAVVVIATQLVHRQQLAQVDQVELAAVVLEMQKVMEVLQPTLVEVAVVVVATAQRMPINQMQEVVEQDLTDLLRLVTHLT
jgi:hypothetical protein